MKLIKRALIAFALVRIIQNLAFGFRVAKLQQALNDEENAVVKSNRGMFLRSALENLQSDLKDVRLSKAQAKVSRAELKKEMIENYV